MIVAFSGAAGSGKDTAANVAIEKYNFTKLSFASTLKDTVAVMFGWDRELLDGTTQKSRVWREQPDHFWSNEFGYNFTPRMALQNLAKGVRDNYKGFWISSIKKKLSQYENVVIADLRHQNEFEFLEKQNAHIIRVRRGPDPEWASMAKQALIDPSIIMPVHESEWQFYAYDFVHIIENDGTKEDLVFKVEKLMDEFTK